MLFFLWLECNFNLFCSSAAGTRFSSSLGVCNIQDNCSPYAWSKFLSIIISHINLIFLQTVDRECRAVKFYSPQGSDMNLLLFSERNEFLHVYDANSNYERKQILASKK